LVWNNIFHRKGVEGIAFYIEKNIFPHIRLHKKDPFNQYMWMEISNINSKNIYIAILYFTPINITLYKKKNLDKKCPYNGLEQDIYSLRNNGSILLLGHFNDRTIINQDIILSNVSNPNPLWLDEDLVLTSRYKRNSKHLVNNLFGAKLFKLCSAQDLIICNGIIELSKSNHITYIHGLDNSGVDYVIPNIPMYNQIVDFDLLNDHETDFDHRPLTLTLNLVMHKSPIEEIYGSQKNLIFDKDKVDTF
jgi:hypothetical protein